MNFFAKPQSATKVTFNEEQLMEEMSQASDLSREENGIEKNLPLSVPKTPIIIETENDLVEV